MIVIATIAIGIGNSHPVVAQVIPDSSLGEESSVVTPNVEVKEETADRIDGGAIRDRNLFHSFSEFNVNEAQRVYFANPSNVEQIFTRVTGSNPSNINGTLGVDGAADLLLLNPNGILFGENSSLDVEGSFFGTSADSVLFENGEEFGATKLGSSLLTISVPVGLQMGNNPGSISVRSPLTMPNGQNFSLLGGEINLTGNDINTENGINSAADGIIAPGGRVELGSLSTTGVVSFGNSSNLVFAENVSKANINLDNYFINASAGGGGTIALQSRNLRLTNSFIVTGINSSVESTDVQAGDITIDTDEATTIEAIDNSQSGILNTTGDKLTGDLSESSQIDDGGETINNTGNAGDISINTNTLSATGYSIISSSTNGEGNAGNININAQDSVSIDFLEPLNPSDLSRFAGIVSGVGELATGNGADLNINAKSLFADNAYIYTLTSGAGNGGNIFMNVDDSIIANNSLVAAQAFSTGDSASIDINTRSLSAENSRISTSTEGAGNAGNTIINATDSIDFLNSATTAETFSSGDAGNIIFESGTANISLENSPISTTALRIEEEEEELVATGRSGDITINGNTLFTTSSTFENGVISTGTGDVIAEGLAGSGNLRLNISDSVTVSGKVILLTNTLGQRNAGNLFIKTKNLTLLQEGQIRAGTADAGNGGNVTIEADEIKLSGDSDSEANSGIAAITQGTGEGGTIDITASNLSINAGGISVRSVGDGNAGSIFARINDSVELDNGVISSRSDRSSGGGVDITAGDIRLRGDSNITTSVENGAGGGGNIILSADSIVAFDDSDIFSFSANGQGGNITLNTDIFFGANYTAATLDANPQFLNRNSRVDLNATGFISGFVKVPEINFLPNSLVELSEDTIDADEVVANSCVVRRERSGGTFIVTGAEGLRSRPGNAAIVNYATGTIRSISDNQLKTNTGDNWQPGDPIVEPNKAYRLSNGKLVLSRECN